MRTIGLDVHGSFAQVAILENAAITAEHRLELVRDKLTEFARGLRPDDEAVLEATGNTAAVVRLLQPHVGRVVVANPLQLRAIVHARVKTDKVDAAMLARMQAAGFIPEVWVPDEDTLDQRRFASERAGVGRELLRAKSRIHVILHANLLPAYECQLFSKAGRRWLASQDLPTTEREMLDRQVVQLEQLTAALQALGRKLARHALDDPRARRLMTIAGDRRDRRNRSARRDRRPGPVPDGRQAGQLFEPRAEGASVRRAGGPARADHQGRQRHCPAHAGRGGLVGFEAPGPVAGLFSAEFRARAAPPWPRL